LAKAEQEKKKAALVPQPKKTVVIKSPVVVKPVAAKEIEKQPRKDFGDHQAKPPMKPRNDRDRDGGGMHRDRGGGGGGGGQGRGGGGYPRQQRRPQNEQSKNIRIRTELIGPINVKVIRNKEFHLKGVQSVKIQPSKNLK
jgi:hypothetical protein